MTVDYTQPPRWSQPPAGPRGPARSGSGCLKWGAIGCAALLALVFASVIAVVFFLFDLIKSSDVYTGAVRRAQSDPRAVAMLGTPIETGWWIAGSVHFGPTNGEADFVIPLKGPLGRARLRVKAARSDRWHYERLTLTPATGGQPSVELLR